MASTSLSPPLPPPAASKISPAVLFVIVILAVLFFISGLLHLLLRFLTKHPNPSSSSSSSSSSNGGYPEISTSEALQRQLQQLFNLHDSGLDQSFIDALPVFLYAEVVGPNEPFDCAVCLSEFANNDKLRLLPICSHAFHITCIDTWLLSNSTCPLCRDTLFPVENPVFEYDEFQQEEEELGLQKRGEIEHEHKAVLPIRLGKFTKLEDNAAHLDEPGNSNLDARRCYSMGSYQYVLANTNLRVNITSNKFVRDDQEHNWDSEGKKISSSMSRGDSYSVSKIWLWPKKGDFSTSSSDAINTKFSWIDRNSNV